VAEGRTRPFETASGPPAFRGLKVLAVSGSLREASSNTRALRALGLLAGPTGEVLPCPPLDALPFFNPDVEQAGLPPAVQAWRASVAACDAVVISSPEYAHGVSGVLKNALDWLVGGIELNGKPIAVLNVSAQAFIAHAALVETLRIMGGLVVLESRMPLTGRDLEPEGIASDPALSAALQAMLARLQDAARS
jgi:chromate reductase, NAD(P)H dehydrogenase (quinone)